ncbi:MAG: hypothetical protein IKH15_03700, partial [Bacteroidales bacterium]|nr:hypothetical protein [Bacteroidales bacterium]
MRKRIIPVLLMMMCCSTVSAQNLDVFHFMKTNPFQHFDTPSSECVYNGYVALPTSNIGVCANLGSIRYNKLFETDAQGYPVTLTATRFVNSLAKNNYLGVNTNVELLGFGFRVGNVFVTLDYRLRLNGFTSGHTYELYQDHVKRLVVLGVDIDGEVLTTVSDKGKAIRGYDDCSSGSTPVLSFSGILDASVAGTAADYQFSI